MTKTKAQELEDAFVGPMTRPDLMKATGCCATTVHNFLKARMAEKPRTAHVAWWRPLHGDYGCSIAVYAPGPGEDAEQVFSGKTVAVRVREWRARQREKDSPPATVPATPAPRAPPRPDFLTSCFFGTGA